MSNISRSDSTKSNNGRTGLGGSKRVQSQKQPETAAEGGEAAKGVDQWLGGVPKETGEDPFPGGTSTQPAAEQPLGGGTTEAQGIQDLLQQTGGGAPKRADFEDTRSEAAVDIGLVFNGGSFARELAEVQVKPYHGGFVKEGAFAADVVSTVFKRFWGLDLAGLTLEQRLLGDRDKKTLAKMNLYLWCYLHASNEAESGIGGGGVIDTGGRMELAGISVTGETISKSVFTPAYSVHRFTRTQCQEVSDAIAHILTLSAHQVPGYAKLETLIRSRAADYKLSHLPQYAFVGADCIEGLRPQVLATIKDAQGAYVSRRSEQSQNRNNQRAAVGD